MTTWHNDFFNEEGVVTKPAPVVDIATPNVRLHADIRALLKYMSGEYVSPTLTSTMKRLRAFVDGVAV